MRDAKQPDGGGAKDRESSHLALCVAALGLYWTWTFFSFNPPTPAFSTITMHLSSMAGAAAAFVTVALFRRRLAPLCARRDLLLGCAAVAALCTPAYMLPLGPLAIAVGAACLSGAAIAVPVCALGEAFCRLGRARLLIGTVLSFLMAYAALLGLGCLTAAGGMAAAVAVASPLPVACCVLLPTPRPGRDADPAPVENGPRLPAAGLPWRTLCIVACMYFAIGGIRSYVEHATGTLALGLGGLVVGIALLAAALAGTLYASQRPTLRLGMFYKVAVSLVSVAYVAMLVTDRPEALGPVAQTICLAVEILCWVLIVDSTCTRGLSPLLVVGIGRLVVQLGMSMGELAGLALPDNTVALGSVTVFLLVLSLAFLFSERETSLGAQAASADGSGRATVRDAETASPGLVGAASVEARSGAKDLVVPPDWNLTEREQAVLVLWVTSHGLRSIGATLGLSESTVKTHVRHIYEKCGVHSKAELIGLVDSLRSDP